MARPLMKKTPKKPDRFERVVTKKALGRGESQLLYATDIIRLLRQEHRWVINMVRGQFKVWATTSPDGYVNAPALRHERAKQCRDILDRLTRRAL